MEQKRGDGEEEGNGRSVGEVRGEGVGGEGEEEGVGCRITEGLTV